MVNKNIFWIVLVWMLGIGVFYYLFQHRSSEPLLVISSAQAEIIKDEKNQFFLVVHPMGKKIVWFTDRPHRETGAFPVPHLLAVWEKDGRDSFSNDPPNASFAGLLHENPFNAFIGLSHPAYDEQTNSLRFDVTRLDGKPLVAEDHLTHVTLFVE